MKMHIVLLLFFITEMKCCPKPACGGNSLPYLTFYNLSWTEAKAGDLQRAMEELCLLALFSWPAQSAFLSNSRSTVRPDTNHSGLEPQLLTTIQKMSPRWAHRTTWERRFFLWAPLSSSDCSLTTIPIKWKFCLGIIYLKSKHSVVYESMSFFYVSW